MACTGCKSYFEGWRSHSPIFPDQVWEPIKYEEFELGTHGASVVMEGTAKCRSCGQLADFGCTMPDGYYFSAAAESNAKQ